ncbi:Nucleotidyltransferase domain-containing protein [Lachnospiraceae bacterium]|nr:Nucleotidyltransferase domain-containing protein [Lachnospiraceae bacterium]
MCQLVSLNVNGKSISVASIKIEYIKNIVDNIFRCDLIDKVVLFGSSLEERCTEKSDIDLAIFGKKTKSKMFNSKSYKDYIFYVTSFGEIQDYDILYFDSTKKNDSSIMKDIENGVVLYERVE